MVYSDLLLVGHDRYIYDPKNPNGTPASLYFGAGSGYEQKAHKAGEYSMTHTDRRIKVKPDDEHSMEPQVDRGH